MQNTRSHSKRGLWQRAGSFVGRLSFFALFLVLTACEIIPTKSIDDAINEIDRVRQTVAGESSAWRDELPKLTRTLQGLESQVNADIKGVVADAANQAQDLATQSIQLSDAKAQDLIAQAGAEFRCNAGFVKAGVVAQLQYMVDDLKFWKGNNRHLDRKPDHAVCWINPNALSLFPTGNVWAIDTSNMADRNIARIFGYNFWPTALPKLELQGSNGQKIRDINLAASYVTHYQINLDFSAENFAGVKTGDRVVMVWPDIADPNTINLTLQAPAKIKLSAPVFTPATAIARNTSVSLRVTVANTGGLRSGNFVVTWKPDPNESQVFSVSRQPLNPGESAVVSFPGYVYQRNGTINSVVSLSNGDDTLNASIAVSSAATPTPLPPPSNKFKIEVTTGDVFLGGTDANVFITLFGDLANSPETQLDSPGNDFERGNTDTFNKVFNLNIGNLTKIRIRHDNSGAASGWFLERIAITNLDTGRRWTFTAHRWLATDEGDRQTDIFLNPN